MKEHTIWTSKKNDIQFLIDSGTPIAVIASDYGVTRARMYQVLNKLGISTPRRTRKRHMQLSPKQIWLNRILCHHGFNKDDRLYLLNTLHLPDTCPALKIALNYDGPKDGSRGMRADDSPSLDRITPILGYTKDNIQVLSWLANRIKTNATPAQVLAVGKYLTNT